MARRSLAKDSSRGAWTGLPSFLSLLAVHIEPRVFEYSYSRMRAQAYASVSMVIWVIYDAEVALMIRRTSRYFAVRNPERGKSREIMSR